LHFTAFLKPSYAKWQLLLMTAFDEVEVANFKNLKVQHAIRHQAL
jgi:hypothetical protein